MSYVDGFIIPVQRKNLKTYLRTARQWGRIVRDLGAIEFHQAVADDAPVGKSTSFPRSVKLKRGETVVFAWIIYKSRAHRDRVMKKVMKDPRTAKVMQSDMPFDTKRMIFGGFRLIVDA